MPAPNCFCPDLLVSTLHCSPSSHFFPLHVSFLLLEFNDTLPFCRTAAMTWFLKPLSLAGQENKTSGCHWDTAPHLPCAVPGQPGGCSLWDTDLQGTARNGLTCSFSWVLECSALGISFHFLLSHQLNTHWKIKVIAVKYTALGYWQIWGMD